MDKTNSTRKMVMSAFFVVLNIVMGFVVGALKIPLLFMDTIGTVFGAVWFGPVWGMVIGGLSNVLLAVTKNPKDLPFALVNIAIGLVVGLIARKHEFDLKTAIITGLLLAVVAPLIGTPIAVYVYGGITGDFNDVFFTALKQGGSTIFSAAFLPRIASNIVDKVLTCVIVTLTLPKIRKGIKS
ncbi:CD3073 family putative ECF transporter S component [Mediannikoviicoccus vaginalis]|uniref:CD3073 family putative ECF transporter S component n=1 Tax=Mediannikoviicoccus vaginalis TaxID=2899727 RepID=UPI001F2E38FB|nr:CD3073 family putative ECF transporter S component [Mediannikoviicoccus vaginalis]